jgi:hypothetical protein
LSCDERATPYRALEKTLVGELAEYLFEQSAGDTIVGSRPPCGWKAFTSRENTVQHCGAKGLIQIAAAQATDANRWKENTS